MMHLNIQSVLVFLLSLTLLVDVGAIETHDSDVLTNTTSSDILTLESSRMYRVRTTNGEHDYAFTFHLQSKRLALDKALTGLWEAKQELYQTALAKRSTADYDTMYPTTSQYDHIVFLSRLFMFTVPKTWQPDAQPLSFGDIETMLQESWNLLIIWADLEKSRGPPTLWCDVVKMGIWGKSIWRVSYNVTSDGPAGNILRANETVFNIT